MAIRQTNQPTDQTTNNLTRWNEKGEHIVKWKKKAICILLLDFVVNKSIVYHIILLNI